MLCNLVQVLIRGVSGEVVVGRRERVGRSQGGSVVVRREHNIIMIFFIVFGIFEVVHGSMCMFRGFVLVVFF